jgi:hypothetical protein
MKILGGSEANSVLVLGLGISEHYTANDLELLAALARQTAAFNCPCSLNALGKALLALIRPLDSDEDLNIRVHECLEELLAYGDLAEIRDQDDTKDLVTLTVPAAVKISSHRILLVGAGSRRTASSMLPVGYRVDLKGCARTITVANSDTAMSDLLAAGFSLLTFDEWCHPPRSTTAEEHIAKYTRKMASQDSIGSLGELELLVPESDVKYYRGRWKVAKTQTGVFVARRARRFGSPMWCLVKLQEGNPVGLVNFPTTVGLRGCDEAWHLQQAIDRSRSTPQRFRVRFSEDGEHGFLDFFSPVPEWANRRWNALGDRMSFKGSLFSYRFDAAILADEMKFAEARMWMTNDDRTYQ